MADVIDLTIDDDADGANENRPASKYPPAKFTGKARVPFQPISNNAQSSGPSRAEIAAGLTKAIDSAKIERLREIPKKVCRESNSPRVVVEKDLLVVSESVVPYHADTESEDDEDSLISSEEESEEESKEEEESEEEEKSDEDDSDGEGVIEALAKQLQTRQLEQNMLLRRGLKIHKTMD